MIYPLPLQMSNKLQNIQLRQNYAVSANLTNIYSSWMKIFLKHAHFLNIRANIFTVSSDIHIHFCIKTAFHVHLFIVCHILYASTILM